MTSKLAKLFYLLAAALLLLAPPPLPAETHAHAQPDTPSAYVIPIQRDIDPHALAILKRGLQAAKKENVDFIVLSIDTHGGRLDITEKMTQLILETKTPVYAYIKYNAISAGAIIAFATDHIYMQVGSKIGDAIPVVMGGGGYEEQGEAEREKLEGFTEALMRSVAQQSGHDVHLGSCMVRRMLEYKINDEIICKEGEILVLTAIEAARTFGEGDTAKPLLSEATVTDIGGMFTAAGHDRVHLIDMEFNWAENVATTINQYSPLLLTIGTIGILLAIYNPAMLIPGLLVAGAAYAIFFFGNHVHGLAGAPELVVFGLGIILLALEAFVIPGFGVAGILGILCILGSLVAAMTHLPPVQGQWLPSFEQLALLKQPLMNLSLSILMTGIGAFLISMIVPRTRTFNSKMVLETATNEDSGYRSSKNLDHLLHQTGTALTDLRPSGTAQLDGAPVNVQTEGGWIEKNTPIKVTRVSGNVITVTQTETEAT